MFSLFTPNCSLTKRLLKRAVIFENYQEAKALSLERVRRAKVEHELLMNELAQQASGRPAPLGRSEARRSCHASAFVERA